MASLLVVDDHREFREALAEALQVAGHEVLQAEDGRQALRRFREHPVDLVVTDVLMPEKDGLEIIMEMRKERPGLGVIAISSGGRIGAKYVLEAARALGADKVFTKPVDFREILAVVDELLTGGDS